MSEHRTPLATRIASLRRSNAVRALGMGLALTVVLSTVAGAITVGSVDGVWGVPGVPKGSGADRDLWATGPGNNFTYSTNSSSSRVSTQNQVVGDENHVRYGDPAYSYDYEDKSGLGFDGVNAPAGGLDLVVDEPFYLGKFTHYNFPIYVDGGAFGRVDLVVNVPDFQCADGSAPEEGGSLDFTYEFYLEETPNWGTCAYSGSPKCPDRVTVSSVPEQTFTCPNDGDNGESVEYIMQILGFLNNANCETVFDRNATSTAYITNENQANTACLWGRMSSEPLIPTAVTLAQFDAKATIGAVEVTWETVSEVDNLGFNLYRANGAAIGGSEAGNEDWTQLNDALIPGTPGATAGQSYRWLDSTVESGKTYVYRLDAIDTTGAAEEVGTAQVPVAADGYHRLAYLPIFGASQHGTAAAASAEPACTGDCPMLTRIELQVAQPGGEGYSFGGDVIVRDQAGRRLAGATVTVVWTTGDGESQMTASSDASGVAHFDYAGIANGLKVLSVERPGYSFDAASSETDIAMSW